MTKKENMPELGEQLEAPMEEAVNESVEAVETVGTDTAQPEESAEPKYTLAKPVRTRKKAQTEPEAETAAAEPQEAQVATEEKVDEASANEVKVEEPILTEEKQKEQKRGGKRRARSRGGPAVMSIDARRTVETDADKAKNDLIDLTESLKADKILTGTVQGIERNFQGHNSVAVLYHGVFKVVIPAEDMVEKPQESEDRSLDESYHYLLTRRLGAETDYIVNSIFYDDMLAFASRLDAMQVKRKRFYRGGEGALVHEGVRAEARVVSVIRAGIFVDLFGVECFIPLRELSYQRIGNAMSLFKTGDRVIVKVLSVENKDMNNIKIQASVKQASVNPYELALKKYSVGNRYVGTVSMVDKNGVFVSLEGGVDCLCRFPARGRPMKGARATVQILGIDEKSNRIWGIITHSSMTL